MNFSDIRRSCFILSSQQFYFLMAVTNLGVCSQTFELNNNDF